MSYTAKINGVTFFKTNSDDRALALTSAQIDLTAGSAGTFVFTATTENIKYGRFNKLIDYVDVYRNDEPLPIFSGRVTEIETDFDLNETVTCEGMLTVLSDTIFRPITHDGTLHELVEAIITNHNNQVDSSKQLVIGTIFISETTCYRAYENYETSISRLQDLVDSYGGYLGVHRTADDELEFNWYADYIEGNTQGVDFGENLLDLTFNDNSDDIATIIVPLGAKNDDGTFVDISSVNEGRDYLVASEQYIQKYGYVMTVQQWDDVTVPSILKSKGQAWLAACLTDKITIDVTAVDLANVGYDYDNFKIGQKLKVTSIPHNLNGDWFNCNQQSIDCLHPENDTLSMGEVKVGYVQSRGNNEKQIEQIFTRITATKADLEDAIDHQTRLITGNLGGYVVMHDSDDDGEPDELLVMDAMDIDNAVNVWRFNKNGLGHSSSGYDGPYTLGMTMDGSIVASMITTGVLNANLLKAGVIRGQQGNSYWDLNTGVLHIEGSGDIDKSKVFIYEPVPPYYVGDLWCTQRSETSGVVGYAIVDYAIAGDESSGEGGKIMACIYTRTSGTFNPDDWTLITNYVDDSDIQIIQQRISSAELNIDANAAEIQTKASVEVVDQLGNQLALAQTEIDQNAHDITLKATESDITGNYIIGKINLNATTATIEASHIDLQGAVTISSFDPTASSTVVKNVSTKNQYYLSTSSSSATGGSWSNTVTWSAGKYIWTKIVTTKTYVDNTTSTTESSAIYDSNLTNALSTANSATSAAATAQSTANGAIASTVSVYYRSTSSSTPSISTSSSIGTSDSTDNAWEYVLPRPKNSCYFFTCERYTTKAGDVSFSTVRQMSNLTISSLWCSANNASYIDGGHIYASSVTATQIASSAITTDKLAAGSVTAAKISVTDLQALGATIGGFTIDSTSIHTKNVAITSNASNSLGISSSTFTRKINNIDRTNLKIAVGGNFAVNQTGTIYSGDINGFNAVFGGSLSCTGTSSICGWTINGGYYSGTLYGSSFGSSASSSSVTLKNPNSTNQPFLQASANNATNFTATTAGTVTVSGVVTCQRCSETSDREVKTDIYALDAEESERFIYGLNPVRFRNISNVDTVHHGFVAQDVEELVHDWDVVTNYDAESNGETVRRKALSYTEIIADLVKTVQRQNERIKALEG